MAKFNEVQKKRRALISQNKRAVHGVPFTKKLKRQTQLQSVSGKRKKKNLKKWRRDQKELIEKGLVTLDDVDMAPADGRLYAMELGQQIHQIGGPARGIL
ncbi:uncharacterized protein [Spinacia oleracea]|uniref:Ribosome biogenesis protein NOP53 n=1 Tax=Spinacia oleracea TaxID=3562 RepID=A0ABM3RER6_SPIOL|nr:uncharacterized protein LOC130469161 [Spinacia oleracea]